MNNCANIFVRFSDYFFRINSNKWNCPNKSSEKEIEKTIPFTVAKANSNNEVLGNAQKELGLKYLKYFEFL